jgi:hypothetical protein
MRIFLALLFVGLLFPVASNSAPTSGLMVSKMLNGVLVTGASSTFGPSKAGEKVFQATVTGTGAVTATVLIQVSNNVSTLGWITLGTITLSGTTTATDGFASEASWAYYRANVTAVSGTGAAVYVTVAEE